jgi:hypothetical protein
MMLRSLNAIRWAACTAAGCVYASGVFAVGFGIGTIRVLFLVPRVGAAVAVLSEAPVMLAVSWSISKWVAKKFDLNADAHASLLMGAIAFAVLMLAELGVSVFVFGNSMVQHLAAYWSVPGAIGLAAQICFATFPSLQASRS